MRGSESDAPCGRLRWLTLCVLGSNSIFSDLMSKSFRQCRGLQGSQCGYLVIQRVYCPFSGSCMDCRLLDFHTSAICLMATLVSAQPGWWTFHATASMGLQEIGSFHWSLSPGYIFNLPSPFFFKTYLTSCLVSRFEVTSFPCLKSIVCFPRHTLREWRAGAPLPYLHSCASPSTERCTRPACLSACGVTGIQE